MRRVLATSAFLLLAFGGFLGAAGATDPGPLNPFGWLFLFTAAAVWRCWGLIAGDFSPPHFEGMWARIVGSSSNDNYFRAADDHYRRDGQHLYRETEGTAGPLQVPVPAGDKPDGGLRVSVRRGRPAPCPIPAPMPSF